MTDVVVRSHSAIERPQRNSFAFVIAAFVIAIVCAVPYLKHLSIESSVGVIKVPHSAWRELPQDYRATLTATERQSST
jgi:hypothetical protein